MVTMDTKCSALSLPSDVGKVYGHGAKDCVDPNLKDPTRLIGPLLTLMKRISYAQTAIS